MSFLVKDGRMTSSAAARLARLSVHKSAAMKNACGGLLAYGLVLVFLCSAASDLAISAPKEAGIGPRAVGPGVRLASEGAERTIQVAKGAPNVPIPLHIGAPSEAQGYRFALIRGLPSNATLTVGFAIRQSWFVSARDAPRIQLIAPPEYVGSFPLEVLFFRESGEPPIGRTLIPVLIDDQGEPSSAFTSKLAPTLTRFAIFSPSQESAMLARATELVEQGDLTSARLIYEDLAARGSAKGALAMGQSWDPHYMKNVFVLGLKPNPEIARLWYLRALDMGNADAQSRLSKLSANGLPQ